MQHTEQKFEEAVRMAAILPAQEHFLEEAVAARWLGMAPSGLAQAPQGGNGPTVAGWRVAFFTAGPTCCLGLVGRLSGRPEVEQRKTRRDEQPAAG